MNMKNSIRVRSKAEYTVEVNDNGDTIVFDTADTGLTGRMLRMFEEIDQLTKDFEARAQDIDAQPDEPLNVVQLPNEDTGMLEDKTVLTKNQAAGMQMIDDFYKAARSTLDHFLGEGACQKIFGDKNYNGMFDDLLEQLEPHFKKMGLNAERMRKEAAAKHAPNREQRRALR